jgi:MoxR-like ATPase
VSATFDRIRPGLCSKLRPKEPLTLQPDVAPPKDAVFPTYRAVTPRDAMGPGSTYDLSAEAAEAVNVALELGQPLLVTGEPGCGKTDLAYGVALQLGLSQVWRYDTQSSSTADDLFYRFDHLARFHDANLREGTLRPTEDYVELQALGAAVLAERTQVVLIDEIDKAPRDLPNDLLARFEEPMRFRVREVPGAPEVQQRARHLVIVTSNAERELPDPFLRRCVYLLMDFPSDPVKLTAIVARHLKVADGDASVREAAERFLEVRDQLATGRADARKPSTSELIQWARALRARGLRAGTTGDLPLASALLKHREEREVIFGKKR